jgi:trans-L-3-hydroxyproline dehydratase
MHVVGPFPLHGGTFYALVSATTAGVRGDVQALAEFDEAAAALKRILVPCTELYAHPSELDLEYLYSVMVVEETLPEGETGLCFFADQQIDHSPTGSCVMARVALAVDRGRLQIGEGREMSRLSVSCTMETASAGRRWRGAPRV